MWTGFQIGGRIAVNVLIMFRCRAESRRVEGFVRAQCVLIGVKAIGDDAAGILPRMNIDAEKHLDALPVARLAKC
jgi:hypothetical protein